MTFSEYIENLAERHVDIRHKENDEVHFLSSEREKHTALDSVLPSPAVIVDRGSGFGYGGNPGAYRKDRDYLRFIVEHVSDTSDYEQIEAALDKCERILDELLNQILEDKRKKRLWLAFSLEDVEADSGSETEAGTTQREVVRHGVVSIPVSFSVTAKWLKKLAGYAKKYKISVQYFDVETAELKLAEMYVTVHKAKLKKDTSYKGLWTVSFTLKEM